MACGIIQLSTTRCLFDGFSQICSFHVLPQLLINIYVCICVGSMESTWCSAPWWRVWTWWRQWRKKAPRAAKPMAGSPSPTAGSSELELLTLSARPVTPSPSPFHIPVDGDSNDPPSPSLLVFLFCWHHVAAFVTLPFEVYFALTFVSTKSQSFFVNSKNEESKTEKFPWKLKRVCFLLHRNLKKDISY